ncbi:MAG: hypothetical protein R8K50_11115, partial [Mariprofundus sp.]
RLSASLRLLAMEQPLLHKRALQITTGQFAVLRFVGKGQGSSKTDFTTKSTKGTKKNKFNLSLLYDGFG